MTKRMLYSDKPTEPHHAPIAEETMTYSKIIQDKVLASERALHRAPATKAATDAFRPVDLGSLTKEEALAESQRLYRDHSNYALHTFRNAEEELLDLGWPVPHIAGELLWAANVKELTPELVAEVNEELARIADLEEEDEDFYEDDDFDEGEEDLVRFLKPALAKLKAETEAGTLSEEKRAAIFTIFGDSFMEPHSKPGPVAEQLHEYMTFRAGRERQKHELTPDYYQKHLDAGVGTFFGIEVNHEGLVADRQQPLLFEEWKNRRVQ